MIRIVQEGKYKLIETNEKKKILTLRERTFSWAKNGEKDELIPTSYIPAEKDYILAIGKYRLYDVKDEFDLADVPHLELLVGEGKWQGYIVPSGIPSGKRKQSVIMPTGEIITKTKSYDSLASSSSSIPIL